MVRKVEEKMTPRCYHCGYLLGDINDPCPNCLPNFRPVFYYRLSTWGSRDTHEQIREDALQDQLKDKEE